MNSAPPAAEGTSGDHRWLLGAGGVALGLCAVPYLVAAILGPVDFERGGTFWYDLDVSQYQAAMREASRGASWLVHDHFTAEPHAPALMFTLYVALGKLAAVTGLAAPALFGALEWVSRIVLLLALYVFAATFLPNRAERHLAIVLAAGTLGLVGFFLPLAALFQQLGGDALFGALPTALALTPELSTFVVLLVAPHIALGLACTLLCAPVYLRAQEGQPRWLLALAGLIVALSLLHPFNLPILASVLVADCALRSGARGAWPSRCEWAVVAVLLVAVAPVAIYYGLLFHVDPFWSGTYGGAQNETPTPPPWGLPMDFGLVLLAAPAAWPAVRSWPTDRRRLLLLWVGLGLLAMYAPVTYQRRFGLGVQPGLAVLAAVGLRAFTSWMRTRRWGPVRRRLGHYGLVLAAAGTSVFIYVSLIASAALNAPIDLYPWSRAEADADRWLAAHSAPDDVVLASTPFANPLVGVIDGRVVHGHGVATWDSPTKDALVARFFARDAAVGERSALLRRSAATVIGFGPRERALGATSLADQPELRLVYDQGGVAWYRVRAGHDAVW